MCTMESPTGARIAPDPAKETNQKSRKPKPPTKRTGNSKEKKHSKVKRDKKKKDVKTIQVLKKGVPSIEFDATARYQHLTGFSERKRARRTFGLAQQKMKDRKAKLEHRAAIRTAERDFITEAEQRKQQHYDDQVLQQQQSQHGALLVNLVRDDDDDDDRSVSSKKVAEQSTNHETVQILFDGTETEQQWGGHVVVTTSTHIPGDSDNEDDNNLEKKDHQRYDKNNTNHDTEQVNAGKIEKYIKTIQGHLPKSKKRTTVASNNSSNKRTKGQHGAANMKGVGNAADFKVAQQMLSRSSNHKLHKGGSSSSGTKRSGRSRGKK